jgi:hypothetical protein
MADRTDVLKIEVDCSLDARGEMAPRQVTIGRRRLDVVEVLDRWPGSDHRYYKIKADDGATYILRHDTTVHIWQLVLFDSSGRL